MKKTIPAVIIAAAVVVVSVFLVISHVDTQQSSSSKVIYGNVDIRDVVLSFRVAGRIEAMLVDEGDRVSPGMLLARLDKDTFLANLAKATADLALARAQEKNAKEIYQRRAKLVTMGAVSQALYDDAVAMRDQTQAQVAVAQATVEQAKIALNDTEIHAPSEGNVLTRVREPGAVVAATDAVYSVAVAKPVWVRTYIDEPSLGLIHPGQAALVYTDSRPDKPYHGHVGYISPQAEFTPKNVETTQLRTDLVYRLRVVIDDRDQGLRQGMPVTVNIGLNSTGRHDKH